MRIFCRCYEVLIAVVVKIAIFQDFTPCSVVRVLRCWIALFPRLCCVGPLGFHVM